MMSLEDTMSTNHWDKVEDVATELDDVKLAVEELKDEPPPGAKPDTVDALHQAVEKAIEAADQLDNQNDT